MRNRPGPSYAAAACGPIGPALRRCIAGALLGSGMTGCTMHSGYGPPSDRNLGWVCQHSPAEDPHLWVNLVLDADGRPASRSVGWRLQRSSDPGSASTDLFWTLPQSGPWHAGLDRAEFGFASTDPPSGPVHATLELDGAAAVHEQVLDRKAVRRSPHVRPWGATLHLEAGSSSAAVLHAATTARILLIEGGRSMSTVRVRLPDWRLVDSLVMRALGELDRDASDFTGKCERQTDPEVDPIGVL